MSVTTQTSQCGVTLTQRMVNMNVLSICYLLTLYVIGEFLAAPNGRRTTARKYIGAVYEHAVILPPVTSLPVSRQVALENMRRNLDVFTVQAEKARSENVDILVFPEDGVYGPMFQTRAAVRPYLEFIPDPNSDPWNPCTDPSRYPDTDVQRFLSCLARDNSLYVVANIGDVQPCNKTQDPGCPGDGNYQYNTDVAYDNSGCLVARYHKRYTFYEPQFDTPAVTEFVYFDTPFGRFGVFTCFDVLFRDPAVTLVEKYNVTDVVFPTAWMDALPLLSSIQFHSGWAAGMGVNMLAANIHIPSFRFHGSGIYTPAGAVAYYYDSVSTDGRLLISGVPVSNTPDRHSSIPSNGNTRASSNEDRATTLSEFNSTVFHDLFTFVALDTSSNGVADVCQGTLCCHLDFIISVGCDDDFYAFGAFDGLHTYQGKYYQQICTLLKCASNDPNSCGAVTTSAQTVFKYFHMQATFGTRYVFPEILLTENGQLRLAEPGEWIYAGQNLIGDGIKRPVLAASLYGRVYGKDGDTA